MTPLRVLHCPADVGGHPGELSRAERELGLASVCVAFDEPPFGYLVDDVLRRPGEGRGAYERRRLGLLWRALTYFDVVHFNFGRGILPWPPLDARPRPAARAVAAATAFADLRLLRRKNRRIFVTFQGDDVRQGDVLRRLHETSIATVAPQNYPPRADSAKRRVVAALDRYADGIFYLNPDLAHVLPTRAEFLPYASVDVREWRPVERTRRATPVVVHAPSDRLVKGTRHIVDAVEKLRGQGVPLELDLVEGVSRAEARTRCARADLFVDQLHVGWYGGAAAEAMSLGVPVVSFLRDDDLALAPTELVASLPILNATPETLERVLRAALADPCALEARGRRSRAFAERWHDPLVVARRVADAYTAVLPPRQERVPRTV